jgi:hypothetical protein
MRQKWYKAVRKGFDGNYYSWSTYIADIKVQYFIDRFVKPRIPNSKIFVFKSLSCAQLWCRNAIIFEVEIKGIKRILNFESCFLEGEYYDFWNKKSHNFFKSLFRIINSGVFYYGFYGADEVKLIKEVKC